MPVNRLVSIIDEQSMLEFYVIIDFIDQLIYIDCHRLVVIFYGVLLKTGPRPATARRPEGPLARSPQQHSGPRPATARRPRGPITCTDLHRVLVC